MQTIAIFGASQLGKKAYEVLKDKFKVLFFIDNDSKKWHEKFCGITVISPKDIKKYLVNKVIIASMYSNSIANQLFHLGIHNIQAFRYYNDRWSLEEVYDINKRKKFSCKLNSLIPKRKVLIIAYIFPPLGGSGVQRTLKYVKYLRNFGWEPIVLTVGLNKTNFPLDYSLAEEIPEDVKVIRIDQSIHNYESASLQKLKNIKNLYNFVLKDNTLVDNYFNMMNNSIYIKNINPDNFIYWAIDVIDYLTKSMNFDNIDMIYTTSAPYSSHLIGYMIKKIFKKNWVADFRDEWTNNHFFRYNMESLNYILDYNLEKSVVKCADKIITVTPISTNNYIKNFKLQEQKVITITNGYDERDFINLETCLDLSKFNIVYTGIIYKNSEPYYFVKCINDLIKADKLKRNNIKLTFVGKIDESIRNNLNQMDTYNIMKFTGYKNHKESLRYIKDSNLLLLLVGKEERFKGVYTGKIFEYIRSGSSIIAFSPKDSIVEKLLSKTLSGKNFNEYEDKLIEKYILKVYMNWSQNNHNNKMNLDKINEFDRINLTNRLADVFNEIINI